MIQELRVVWRMLIRSRASSAVAVLALALGIGGVTSTVSSVSAIVLRPFPFPDSARIVSLQTADLRRDGGSNVVSSADFIAWREEARSFERVAAYHWTDATLRGADGPEKIQGSAVSPALFEVLRTPALVGRTLLPEEEQPGRGDVLVLSHRLWRQRFAGSDAVLGQVLTLDERPHTIVGVMPPHFEFPPGVEYWRPLSVSAQHRVWTAARGWQVLARLRPGVSIDEARAELAALAGRIALDHPRSNEGIGVRVLPLRELASRESNRFVLILMAAAIFVLLLACVNVSNLLLARATTRRHEMAVRAALGAGRLRIARLFVLEGLALSLPGALLGALLAAWGVELSKATIPALAYRWVPGLRNLGVDGTVLTATALVAVAAGLGCGLAAAWYASRPEGLRAGLAEGDRGRVQGRGPLGQVLVVAEVALALVLLVGAGVMARTYARIAEHAIGIDPRNVVQMRLSLPEARYPDSASVRKFYDDAVGQLAAVRGVAVAGAADGGGVALGDFRVVGQAPPPRGTATPDFGLVTPGYFAALRLPVRRGRGLLAEDETPGAGAVIVVSESVLRRFWRAGEDPIGATITGTGYGFPPLRVVGVVGDVKDWFRGEPLPTVYVPAALMPQRSLRLFVRTAGEPTAVVAALRTSLQKLDPGLPIEDLRTMERDLWEQRSGVRNAVAQMGVFAAIALLLGATGIYAVVAFSVAQRTRELGVRLALGARPGDLLRMVLGQSLRTVGIGLVLGSLAALALVQVMAHALFGVVKVELGVFVAVVLLLASSALLAAWAPARQAARVDPLQALRAE